MLYLYYLYNLLHLAGESTVIDLTDAQRTDYESTVICSIEYYSCLTGNQWLSDKVYNGS